MKTVEVKAALIVTGDNILHNNARCKVFETGNVSNSVPAINYLKAQSEKFMYYLEFTGKNTVLKIVE